MSGAFNNAIVQAGGVIPDIMYCNITCVTSLCCLI